MSPKIAISIEHLSKKYRVRSERTGSSYKTLRELISQKCAAPFRAILNKGTGNGTSPQGVRGSSVEDFWALRNVSFEVFRGEVIGIIGRNGAGKSTLLKILSRITEPTEGRVRLRGRVASLLEVGTGFHAELTGRENIFLNGAVLGMSRAEIARKFDQIAAFAEVSKFLDTPVKRYSSGMYVRLAFAVAAHLEPEILVVDEVLAVGDAQFQSKCLGKMQDIARQDNRTVLFVSHNLGAISKLCQRCLLLDSGEVAFAGPTEEVVAKYLDLSIEEHTGSVTLDEGNSEAYFTKVTIFGAHGHSSTNISVVSGLSLQLEYVVFDRVPGLEVSLSLYDANGSKVFGSSLSNSKPDCFYHDPGRYVATAAIPGNFLAPGTYSITTGLHQPNIRFLDLRQQVIGFSVHETGSDEYRHGGHGLGSILVALDWSVTRTGIR